MNKQVHVKISGKVQGVWFRASTKQQAEQIGITGWVRNTSDGKVEAVFQGTKDQIDEMIRWCHQGPTLSHVEHIEITDNENAKTFDTFTIKY